MAKSICVFSGSSDSIDAQYYNAATQLGSLIGQRGYMLVFGGGMRGLMGAVAKAAHSHKGHVTGVIPKVLDRPGVVYKDADRLIVTEDLRERKAEMSRITDAFIALPGGFGTIEETMEALTFKQLGLHTSPVVFLNTNRFFEPVMNLFSHLISEKFLHPSCEALYYLADTPEDALNHIETYEPPQIVDKVG